MHAIFWFPLLLMVAVTACQPPPTPTTSAVSETISLAGAWRVTAIDGKSLEFPLEFGADDERLWWEPACAGQLRNYRIRGGSISITPYKDPNATADGLVTVCTIGPPPNLPIVFEAIDAVNRVSPGPQNQITLDGGRRSVTLVKRKKT